MNGGPFGYIGCPMKHDIPRHCGPLGHTWCPTKHDTNTLRSPGVHRVFYETWYQYTSVPFGIQGVPRNNDMPIHFGPLWYTGWPTKHNFKIYSYKSNYGGLNDPLHFSSVTSPLSLPIGGGGDILYLISTDLNFISSLFFWVSFPFSKAVGCRLQKVTKSKKLWNLFLLWIFYEYYHLLSLCKSEISAFPCYRVSTLVYDLQIFNSNFNVVQK